MNDPVLGSSRIYTAREVAKRAGVSLYSARRFWRALGLPAVEDDQVAFTDADVTALRTVSSLVRDDLLDDTTTLALTRAVGRSVDRLASWQVQVLGETFSDELAADADPPAPPETSAVARVSRLAPELADAFEPLVTYAWRRHLESSIRRFVTETAPDSTVPTVTRSVCFADLVSFTRLVRKLPERELSYVVNRFETITSDLISAGGGRVIKTMGDEVLFTAWPVASAAEIALRIADEINADAMLPDVRVGIATGEVLPRLGDIYGNTVNLASRITTLAQPGHVLCDETTATALADSTTVRATGLRRRAVKGLGYILPSLLTWAEEEPRARWRYAVRGWTQ